MNVKYLMSKNTLSSSLLWIKAFKRVTTFIFLFLILLNKAEALNVFSVGTGSWNSTSTWSNTSGGASGAAVPAVGDNVFIEGGFTVTVNVNTAALTSISIAAGSTLAGSGAFTVNATSIIVNGTYNNASTGIISVTTMDVNAAATYIHAINGGTIPTATWITTSNCNITGITTNAPAGLAQNFGNVNWSAAGQTGANLSIGGLTNILGNFTITSTGTGSIAHANASPTNFNVGGNFTITGGIFRGAIGGAGNDLTLNISGNYSQTLGTFDFGAGLGTTTMNLNGNFSQNTGTITESGLGLFNTINFTKLGVQNFASGGTVSGIINYTVNAGSTLQMAAASTTVNGAGTFTLSNGATLGVTSIDGIISAAGTALGNIRTTGGRVFSTGASYIYNGSTNQNVGTGLTQNTPLNVTINNPGFTVSLAAATSISGLLTMTGGILNMADLALTVGSLSGTANITNTTGGTIARTVIIGSDNTSNTYAGVISNGTNTGGVSITKIGTGTLTLGGANTYTGVTTISAGVISVATIGNGGVAGNLGQATNAAANLILDGGTLQYTGVTAATNRSFTLTNGTISIIDVSSNTLTMTGASAATSGALIKEGAGALTLSAANTFTGGFTLNTGTLNINNASALGTLAGTFTINGGTINSLAVIGLVNYPKIINASFIFTGTSNLGLGSGSTTLNADVTITTSANTLLFNGGTISASGINLTKNGAGSLSFGASIVNLNDLNIAAGALVSTSNNLTLNGIFTNNSIFTNNTGTVIFTGAGAIAGSTSTAFNNLTLNGATTVTPDPIINGILILNEGASIASGGVTYGATGVLRYNGTTGFITSNAEFPLVSGPLSVIVNNSGNVILHASRTLASPGVLNLTSGRFILGSNSFTISNAATAAIVAGSAFSATNMVQADGSGQLIRATSGAVTYTYPIGDATATVDYSPVVLAFTVNATTRNIGVNVVNGAHPEVNNTPVQTDYLNRYWILSNSVAAGTYTYTANFTYDAADLLGNQSNLRTNMYNGATWTQDAAGTSTGNILSLTSQTQATFPITNGGTTEFTGRVKDGTTYVWNQTGTASFATATNWTPNRTTPSADDILVFNNGAAATVATGVTTQTIGQLLVSGNTNISLQSGAGVILRIGGANGLDLSIASGSTLQIASTGANNLTISFPNVTTSTINGTLTIAPNAAFTNSLLTSNTVANINGTINNAGVLTSTAAQLFFNSGSTYNHNFTTTFGIIPTANWDANSTCAILGYTTNTGATGGLSQTFGDFTWNCTNQTASVNLLGGLTSIAGNLNVNSSGTASLRLASTQSYTLSIGGNLTISNGELRGSQGNGSIANILILGNYNQTGGIFNLTDGDITNFTGVGCQGNVNIAAGATLTQTAATTTGGVGLFEFEGNVSQTFVIAGTISNAIDFRCNNPAGIVITGTLPINNGATFFRMQGLAVGTISYNATSSALAYETASSITTTSNEWPTANPPINLQMNATSIVTLHASRTISGVYTGTSGILSLGAFDLTLSNNSTGAIVAGLPFSASNMIAAESTGQLKRAIAVFTATPNTYLFPIGDVTGDVEYTAISMAFTTNATARVLGFRTADGRNVNDSTALLPAIDFTTRTWFSTLSVTTGNYTYRPTITYAVPGDVYGTENNMLISNWTGTTWVSRASLVNSPTLGTTVNVTQATLSLNNAQILGRCPVKYWVGGTDNSWTTASNWVPTGVPTNIDNVVISFIDPNPCVISTGTVTVNHFTITGTADFSLASGATLIVNGNFDFDAPSFMTLACGSTFRLNNTTYPQTVPAIQYGNLQLVGGVRVLSNTGTISICNDYSPAGAQTTTGSTVVFNGTTTQSVLTNTAFFNNLTISNTFASVVSARPTTINGTFQINALARYEQTASTFTIAATGSGNVDGFLRGSATGTFSPTGTLTYTSTGTYEHNYTISTTPVIPVSTWLAGSTCLIMGYTTGGGANFTPGGLGQTFHHLTWNCPNQTNNARLNAQPTNINGNLTITSTGTQVVRLLNNSTTTINIGGNLVINGGSISVANNAANATLNVSGNIDLSSGTFDMMEGAGNVALNLGGNFYQSGGALINSLATTASINFNHASNTQTIEQTAGTIANNINWNVNGAANTAKLLTDFNIGTGTGTFAVANGATFDPQTFILSSNGSFNLNAGSKIITANTDGLASAGASGSIRTTTRTYNSTASYTYNNNSAAQITGNFTTTPTANTVSNLTIENGAVLPAGVTLTNPINVTGNLNLNLGLLILGTNNLTVTNTLANAVSGGSSTAFVQTGSSGELRRTITTTTFPRIYNFPVGTSANYTPASFTFTANSTARTLNVRAVAGTHPQINNPNPQVDFIGNRYWKTDLSTAAGTYSYSSQFTFLPSDVNGTLANINLNRFDNSSSWTEDAGSSIVANVLSSGPLTQTTGALTFTPTSVTTDWTGRIINGTYIWNGSVSNVYTNGNNWTPSVVGGPLSTDNIVINVPGAFPLNITGNISVFNFTLNGTGAINMAPGSTFTVNGNLTYAGTPTSNMACNSTFKIAKATSQTVPPLNFGNLDLTGGPRVLNNIGVIGICGAFTPTIAATTITGSTVNYNGTTAQVLSPSAFTFENLTISNTTLPVTSVFNVTASGTTTINSGATLSLTANQLIIPLNAIANVNGTLLVNGGTVSNSGTLNINANGSFKLNNSSTISPNAPIYDATSNLIYNSTGTFNRGLEWSATSGAGYPGNVQISNNTLLDLGNGATAINKAMAGNLLIDDGSGLSMNVSAMTASLTVNGNITLGASGTATLSLSSLAGGELFVGGNWTRNASSIFNHNNKKVTFNKSVAGNQTIAGSSSFETFYDLTIQPSLGNVVMNKEVNALNSLTLLSGKLDLNGNEFTLGNIGVNGTLTGGSATSYLISGNTTAKLTRYTTTNATTYNYPVGDAANYTPISVQFYTGSMAANTQISVDVIPSAHPSIGTSTNYLSRYWQVVPTNMPNIVTPYSVVYQWAPADEATAPIPANLKAFKHNAQGWIAGIGSGAVFEQGNATINPGTRTISWVGLWSFSDFTGNGNGTPLPISLLDFNVQTVLDDVDVTWTTATETNNDFFTVEKSIDGKNFEVAGIVKGAGNSNELLAYSFKDTQPFNGVSYYRLKQTDYDGKYSYTGILSVQFNAKSNNNVFSIFPNPSELNGVYLNVNGADKTDVMVKIVDIAGKLLLSQQLNVLIGNQPLFISTAGIQSGVYILEVSTPTENKSFKLVLKN